MSSARLYELIKLGKRLSDADIEGILAEVSDPDDHTGAWNRTCLMACVTSSYLDLNLVTRLLDKGANINATDVYGSSVLMHACSRTSTHQFVNCIKLLLHRGARIDHCNQKGENALCIAVYNPHAPPHVILALVAAGADLDQPYRGTGAPLVNTFRQKLERRSQTKLLRFLDEYKKVQYLALAASTAGQQSVVHKLPTELLRRVRETVY